MKNCRNGKAVYSCIVTMKRRNNAFMFVDFPLLFVYLPPNLAVGSTGGIEKGRRPFHPRALIVLLVAFLVARVSCIDSRVLFSHTARGGGGGNGR